MPHNRDVRAFINGKHRLWFVSYRLHNAHWPFWAESYDVPYGRQYLPREPRGSNSLIQIQLHPWSLWHREEYYIMNQTELAIVLSRELSEHNSTSRVVVTGMLCVQKLGIPGPGKQVLHGDCAHYQVLCQKKVKSLENTSFVSQRAPYTLLVIA